MKWSRFKATPQAACSGIACSCWLFGVVDLASYVTGQNAGPKTEFARKKSRLIALNGALDVNCALLIDKLSGLRIVPGTR